jgi:8-oxo-dGTP pyrophosphatase MutT (NUDIX family)
MTQYVCCYVEHEGEVLLIEKRKPAWQNGKYNLPGGKIEFEETAGEAAARELFEEAGLEATDTKVIGRISGPAWDVYVVRCIVARPGPLQQKTSERVFWKPASIAVHDERLIQNLLAIIPLASKGVEGWVIYEGPYLPSNTYTIELPCVCQPT